MADLPAGLLDSVKAYLHITWQDDSMDALVTGYINRGMKRLQEIAGASLDFTEEDMPRALLLDYCRYANSQALEVFEKNFEAELLDLNLRTQAPVIDKLTIVAVPNAVGGYSISAIPSPDDGNTYVYQAGTNLTIPKRLDICYPKNGWTPEDGEWAFWDGGSIAAVSGQEIMIAEINSGYEAERAGKVTV